jgi:hypothetical protein
MIQRIFRAIGIVGMIVICGVLSFVLAYSTMKGWQDTPLLNLAFWVVIGLVALLLGQAKKKGSK